MIDVKPTPNCIGCDGTGRFSDPGGSFDGTICVFCIESAIARGETTAAVAYGLDHASRSEPLIRRYDAQENASP